MQLKRLVLSGLFASALLPSVAATKEYYFVGASNDWWNAASYSLTQSPSGNTTMPGSEDRIVTKKGQILYMDDTTVAFLNTIGGINMYDIGSTLYINLTTNATVTCAIGDIGGHGYYDNLLIKDGAGVLSFDGENGTLPTSGIYGNAPNKNSYRYCLSFDVRGGGVRMEPKRSDVYRTYLGGVNLEEGTTFYNVNGSGHQVVLQRDAFRGWNVHDREHGGCICRLHCRC